MIVTFDLEIEKPVEEVGGWEGARQGKAGMACCVTSTIGGPEGSSTLPPRSRQIHLWDRHNIKGLVDLLEAADTVVSFNGIGFDLPIISALYGREVKPKKHFDILAEIWVALRGKKKGWGLDPVCQRTLGRGKSGSGEHAPILWLQGKYAEVFDYCLRDVELTEDLYFHIMEVGSIKGPDGEELKIDGS